MFTFTIIVFSIVLKISWGTVESNGVWRSYAECQGCKLFVDSFENGLKRTSKSNFGGGDPSWEEKHLGSYANSEIRLIEIEEKICEEIEDDTERNYCQSFGEKYEAEVEDWWYRKQKAFPDMYKYFCIEKLGLCRCKSGFKEESGTCVDVDECSLDYKNKCKENQYCLNTEGGYVCKDCDVSCDSCFSSGPEGCTTCSEGYVEAKGMCLKENEDSWNELVFIAGFWFVFIGLYFLKKSYTLAVGIAGVVFCIYISLPDYTFQLPLNIHDGE